jgi:hypothetical protein
MRCSTLYAHTAPFAKYCAAVLPITWIASLVSLLAHLFVIEPLIVASVCSVVAETAE